MKYRLKKDLPFAKAGEIVDVNDEADLWTVRPLDAKKDYPVCDIPENAKEEWIEEVKPREWYEVEIYEPILGWRTVLGRFDTAQEAKIFACSDQRNARFIKVREVIE